MHVFAAVFNQLDRHPKLTGKVTRQHTVLDPALGAEAAADIDVEVNTDLIRFNSKCLSQLIRELWHLDRCPNVEQVSVLVPLCDNSEGLQRDRGVTIPTGTDLGRANCPCAIARNIAPHKFPLSHDVAAVRRMHQRRVLPRRYRRIHDKGQWLVVNNDKIRAILGNGA